MKTAREKNLELRDRLARIAPNVTVDDAKALRRAALTIHRWDELECGNSNDWGSFGIERDDDTNIPYWVVRPNNSNKVQRRRIPDREKGALKRVAAICKRLGLHFYYQSDCRGWPLYVDKEPLPDNNYNRGIGIGE